MLRLRLASAVIIFRIITFSNHVSLPLTPSSFSASSYTKVARPRIFPRDPALNKRFMTLGMLHGLTPLICTF